MNRRDLFKRTAALGLLVTAPGLAQVAVALEPEPHVAILGYDEDKIVDLYMSDLLTIPVNEEGSFRHPRIRYLERLHRETHAAGRVLRLVYFDEHVYHRADGGRGIAGGVQVRFLAAMMVRRSNGVDHYTKSRNGRPGVLPTPPGARTA